MYLHVSTKAVISKTDINRKIQKKNQICLENESKRMIISEYSEYIKLQFRWINLVDHSFKIKSVNVKKIV